MPNDSTKGVDLTEFKKESTPMTITLIGAGNMGGAMLKGWLASMGEEVRFNVVDLSYEKKDIPDDRRITIAHAPDEIKDALTGANLVVFAVKPQIMKEACEQWADHIPDKAAVASICAGIPIAFLQHYFGKDRAYIRMMSNTPASLGKGMTGIYAHNADGNTKTLISEAVEPLGKSAFVNKESDIDSVTSACGSCPAYIFYFVEYLNEYIDVPTDIARDFVISKAKQLEETGEISGNGALEELFREFQAVLIDTAENELGLKENGKDFVNETIIGAGYMLEANHSTKVSQLRDDVTSPNGTTQAALKIMMQGDMMTHNDSFNKPRGWRVTESLKAARKRGKDMGDEALKEIGLKPNEDLSLEEKLEA